MIPQNLDKIFAAIHEHWSPHIVGKINNMDIKAAKFQGDFIWHSHLETDEFFYVHKGHLIIHFRGEDVEISAGEFYVVPKGIEHKPSCAEECHILLIEPSGTANTGEIVNKMTTTGNPETTE